MATKLPYLVTSGTIDNALKKIMAAATPPTFNNDFVHAKLSIKGGAGKALTPFFKKLGFVTETGTPTSLYRQLRNPDTTGAAMAQAMRIGYRTLYEVNEYCHALSDKDLNKLILEVTGLEHDNKTAQCMKSTFLKLKKYADFEKGLEDEGDSDGDTQDRDDEGGGKVKGLNIAYTINLNLPATTNIEVFNAIFQSLRKNLLRDE